MATNMSQSAGQSVRAPPWLDVFISFRFAESHREALALKEALEAHQLTVFLSDAIAGDDLQAAIANALDRCSLVVILASSTYGTSTNDMFDTGREMNFVIDEKKLFFLIRMIPFDEKWTEPKTRLAFSSGTMQKLWLPGTPIPDGVVDGVLTKLGTSSPAVDVTDLSQSAGPILQPARVAAMSIGPEAPRRPARSVGEYPNFSLDGYSGQDFFHRIDSSYPGVQLIHESPYIFVVGDFLSSAECSELIALHASSDKQAPSATSREQAETRTSTTVVPSPAEVGWLRQRIAKLTDVTDEQLDRTKLTHYSKGQFFRTHVDASQSAHGDKKIASINTIMAAMSDVGAPRERFNQVFEREGLGQVPDRCVSVFVYLNDVAKGGCTTFSRLSLGPDMEDVVKKVDKLRQRASEPRLLHQRATRATSLTITPRAGMAVIHFPTTSMEYLCLPDGSTAHESEDAISHKFIVQQFIWASPRDKAKVAATAYRQKAKAQSKLDAMVNDVFATA